jgi:hypothetical protein
MKVTITFEDDTITNLEGRAKRNSESDVDYRFSYSQYARFFDEGCPYWSKDSEYNLTFLKIKEQYCNDLLKMRGHVFLNEVYDELGIPRTKAGQCVGWLYSKDNTDGDNYIDFGLTEINEVVRKFINGYTRTILLDFNVDGVIIDKVGL